jgi:hypothetical protein
MTRDTSGRRWWIWLPLLGIAAWLALFADKSPPGSEVSAATRSEPTAGEAQAIALAKAAGESTTATSLVVIARRELISDSAKEPARDLFAPKSWTPPPPAAAGAQEPPAPPAIPFTYLGKKLEGGTWEVYLARGDQTFIARLGSVIDNTYRIDRIAPPALEMTYLPLARSQTLPIGDSQ